MNTFYQLPKIVQWLIALVMILVLLGVGHLWKSTGIK